MNSPTSKLLTDLSTDFTLAVDALELAEGRGGRAVWTGIGKAGHIARYGSSLMASAAMGSVFLSAGEAAHGDMGMIGANDAVIVLSHSGASSEPLAVVEHARWLRRVPVIAITSDPDSPIAVSSDIVLVYDRVEEELGMVPANASLMQAAIANRLVIDTAKRLGRTLEYLRDRHQGGAIGQAYRQKG